MTSGELPRAGLLALKDGHLHTVQLLGKVLCGYFRSTDQSPQGTEGGSTFATVRHCDFVAVGPMADRERYRSCVLPNTKSDI